MPVRHANGILSDKTIASSAPAGTPVALRAKVPLPFDSTGFRFSKGRRARAKRRFAPPLPERGCQDRVGPDTCFAPYPLYHLRFFVEWRVEWVEKSGWGRVAMRCLSRLSDPMSDPVVARGEAACERGLSIFKRFPIAASFSAELPVGLLFHGTHAAGHTGGSRSRRLHKYMSVWRVRTRPLWRAL